MLDLLKNKHQEEYNEYSAAHTFNAKWFEEMIDRFQKEIKEEVEKDPTGKNFIKDMFAEELGNRDYGATKNIMPALQVLGYSLEEINADKRLLLGLLLATDEFKQEKEEDVVCAFCGNSGPWEGQAPNGAFFFYCENCGEYFCSDCCIKAVGEEGYEEMVSGDRKLLCPKCV